MFLSCLVGLEKAECYLGLDPTICFDGMEHLSVAVLMVINEGTWIGEKRSAVILVVVYARVGIAVLVEECLHDWP
jgi:hypothetical protein